MFRLATCLVIALEIRPQDSGKFDIVISFHNEVISVILLTLRSFMVSWKGKYSMMVCIISGGRSIRLVSICSIGPADVLGIWLSFIVICMS